jgi:hypothetical protein
MNLTPHLYTMAHDELAFHNCYHTLPDEMWSQIKAFVCPLTLRSLNKTYYKRNHQNARKKYPKKFLSFDYLNAMRININYKTLCYFSGGYNKCSGFTKKNTRCKNRSKDKKYCYLHAKKNTLVDYRKTQMYAFLTHDLYD